MLSDTARAALRARDHRVRRAALLSIAVFLVLFGATLVLLSTFAFVPSGAVAAYVGVRALRVNRLVVWLRRFHQSDSGQLPFHRVLGGAASGMAVAVTIQDSTYKTSYLNALARSVFLYPLVIMGFIACLLVAVLLAVLLMSAMPGGADYGEWMIVFFLVPVVGLYGYAVRNVFQRLGMVKFRGNVGRERAQREFDAILDGKRAPIGVRVFACDDRIWRDVVHRYLAGASAVVIDVTDASPNVLWELTAAERYFSGESIILAYEYESERPSGLPPAVTHKLSSAVDPSLLLQHPVFFYPRRRARYGFRAMKPVRALVGELSNMLAAAISAGRATEEAITGTTSH
jgi:hypothetical protein